jgi:hypothetical protein
LYQLHCSSQSFNAPGVDEFVTFNDHDHASKMVWIE